MTLTIALDTSALAAIVFGESDAERFSAAMLAHRSECLLDAATVRMHCEAGDEARSWNLDSR